MIQNQQKVSLKHKNESKNLSPPKCISPPHHKTWLRAWL